MSRLLLLAVATLALGATGAHAQIAAQSFEGAPTDTWTILAGSANVSSAVGATDTPANQRIRTGANSWQVNNGSATLDLASVSVSGNVGVQATVHLSSTSTTTGNGAETGDVVRIYVARDGGAFPATPDITLTGSLNARWGYDATGVAQTTAGTPVTLAAPANGNNPAGYATAIVDIPNGTGSVALRVEAVNNATGEVWNVDDLTLTGTPAAGEVASVAFSPSAATVTEGGSAPLTLVLSITNDQNAPGLDAPLSGTIQIQSGDAGDVTFTASFTFPAGSMDGATIARPIATVDDTQFEGIERVVFEFGAITGGSGGGTFELTINDNEIPPAVSIHEVDADQTGTDTGEFVELIGPPNQSLFGLSLVLVNGSGLVPYKVTDLDGASTDANGLFVVCYSLASAACNLSVGGSIQNGPDAVALYVGNATDFPTSAPVTTTNLLDAVVYSNGTTRDEALLTALGRTVQYRETVDGSIQRLDVNATAQSGLLYSLGETPGAFNPSQLMVDATAGVTPGAGWRFLSVPVIKPLGIPFRVGELAPINLIQGIPAGSINGPQYPNSVDNFYLGYVGGGTFRTVPDTDEFASPGLGILWYWYDSDFVPPSPPENPGSSRSYSLTNPAFSLSLTGVPVDDRLLGAPIQVNYPVQTGDGFYFIGNPFAYPVRLGGATTTTGTLSSVFSVYNGAIGSYETLIADFSNPFNGEALPVWNGVMAEVTGATSAPTFTLSSSFADPTTSPSFIGRSATGRVELSMTGTLTDGTVVNDRAAMVRFVDDALVEWDLHDGSKVPPPPGAFGLIAPVGIGPDGAARRQSVRSLPTTLTDPIAMPVAFTASQDGSFTISWNLSTYQSAGTVQLRDLVTGTVTDLTTATSYTFSASAGAWNDRFELAFGSMIVGTQGDTPAALTVGMPFPNPTASGAALTVRTATADQLVVTVVDALGRTVATPYDAWTPAGAELNVRLGSADLAPGTYLVRVENGTSRITRRLTLLR